jgi:hypothetical protein
MPSTNQVPITEHLDTDLRPGDIGQVVSLHGREYATIAGFGTGFEALIAAGLGDERARAPRLLRRGRDDGGSTRES